MPTPWPNGKKHLKFLPLFSIIYTILHEDVFLPDHIAAEVYEADRLNSANIQMAELA